jgi:hypothetical protein
LDTKAISRKEALKIIHSQVIALPDVDLLRVQKLVKAELRARGSLAALQSEIDDDTSEAVAACDEQTQPAAPVVVDEPPFDVAPVRTKKAKHAEAVE